MNANDLQRFIEENGIQAEIVILSETTPTVQAAARAVGVKPAQIAKSVLFVVKEQDGTKRPQLVVTNGLSRVDYRALSDTLDISRKRVRMARAPEVRQMTGYAVGTVPPFGHVRRIPTLLDETVTHEQEVYAGGGAINALIRLTVDELRRVLQAQIVRLSA
jgi:prolyl-tRNA editing enzyme YbaK/EbsC (Cys-tRNA(Pro) deacylase)